MEWARVAGDGVLGQKASGIQRLTEMAPTTSFFYKKYLFYTLY